MGFQVSSPLFQHHSYSGSLLPFQLCLQPLPTSDQSSSMLVLLSSSDVLGLGQSQTPFSFSLPISHHSSSRSIQRYLVSAMASPTHLSQELPLLYSPSTLGSCCYSRLIVLIVICFYVKSTEFVELRDEISSICIPRHQQQCLTYTRLSVNTLFFNKGWLIWALVCWGWVAGRQLQEEFHQQRVGKRHSRWKKQCEQRHQGRKAWTNMESWRAREKEERVEDIRARYDAGLCWCIVALGLYKGLMRWLLFPEKAKIQKGHTASS